MVGKMPTLRRTVSLSIKGGVGSDSAVPLPAQCVYERFISASVRIWSNARLGSSSEREATHVCRHNWRCSTRPGSGGGLTRNWEEFGEQREKEGLLWWRAGWMHTLKWARTEVWNGHRGRLTAWCNASASFLRPLLATMEIFTGVRCNDEEE